MNVIAQLEFELTYNDVSDKHVCYNASRGSLFEICVKISWQQTLVKIRKLSNLYEKKKNITIHLKATKATC